MQPIIYTAKLISRLERSIEQQHELPYEEMAIDILGDTAGLWSVAFLSSHLAMIDGVKSCYGWFSDRMEVPECYLKTRKDKANKN